MADASEYVTIAQAAELLGVHRTAVNDAVREGKLTAHAVLGKRALLRSDVLAYRPRKNSRRAAKKEEAPAAPGDRGAPTEG
jgi:excisionase family DNA binding protein